jgi:nucleoside-diphosphate-sugar epimerase
VKVFILGGSGFLGRRVIARLLDRGHEVDGLARSEKAGSALREIGAHPIMGDLRDLSGRHAMAETLVASEADSLITSVSLSLGFGPQIVSAAEKAGVRRGMFVSTTSIFTQLSNRSKSVRVEAEARIRSSSLDWTIIRPTMIYGAPDDRNMARLLRFLRHSPLMPLPGGGRGLQQPVHVDDVADLLVVALENPVAVHKIYNVAGPEALSLRQVVEHASHALNKRVFMFPVPLRPVAAAARVYEKLGRGGLRAEQLERLAEDKSFDITTARNELGFDPRPFDLSIRDEAAMLGEAASP